MSWGAGNTSEESLGLYLNALGEKTPETVKPKFGVNENTKFSNRQAAVAPYQSIQPSQSAVRGHKTSLVLAPTVSYQFCLLFALTSFLVNFSERDRFENNSRSFAFNKQTKGSQRCNI
jgi:hypothetical protein